MSTMFTNLLHQLPPHSAVQHLHHPITITNDGVSVAVVRRPRGRPPGTKNKLQSPITHDPKPDPSMSPYFLEVSGGSDIIAAVTDFCNRRQICICVLSGSGRVLNPSLQLPAATTTTALTFQGSFTLVSISATIIPSISLVPAMLTTSTSDVLAKFVVSLASPRGQMLGGAVIGPLIASGTVHIVGAALISPRYHRLWMEDNYYIRNSGYASVNVSAGVADQSPGSSGGDSGQHQAAATPPPLLTELSMYAGYHLPANFMWPPSTPHLSPF